MTIADTWRSAEPWAAGALLAACVLGIAPINIGLGFGLAFLLAHLAIDGLPAVSGRVWLIGVAVFVGGHALAALLSPEISVSLRHLAKDWRLVALFWGATGVLSRDARVFVLLLAAMGVNALWGAAGIFGWIDDGNYGPFRTGSLLGQPMTLGGVASLIIFLPDLARMNRRVGTAIWMLAALLLLASGSRGAWGGSIVGLVVWALLGRPRIPALVGAAVLAIGAALLPATRGRLSALQTGYNSGSGSLGRRVDLWQAAWQMGLEHPTGVGPGRFSRTVEAWLPPGRTGAKVHAHNTPLHLWAEQGILGLLGYVGLFGGLAISMFGRGRERAAVGMGLVAAMVVAGMTELNLYDGEVGVLFFLLAGQALWRSGSGLHFGPGAEGRS